MYFKVGRIPNTHALTFVEECCELTGGDLQWVPLHQVRISSGLSVIGDISQCHPRVARDVINSSQRLKQCLNALRTIWKRGFTVGSQLIEGNTGSGNRRGGDGLLINQHIGIARELDLDCVFFGLGKFNELTGGEVDFDRAAKVAQQASTSKAASNADHRCLGEAGSGTEAQALTRGAVVERRAGQSLLQGLGFGFVGGTAAEI